ncbi:hypothetical protein CGLO_12693 [Colletotrichum gloeosporioides Cg-14]|uniref:Uncharacterized protein n=1 Tax=Colletotrichum gloeosporioides (strain Cg-14) TaxID=1237896 RepID=T0K554_COLGC|nr:hypothetical protein CGLO_12693 [Colletotrichum gloeosporioides Cg-14]
MPAMAPLLSPEDGVLGFDEEEVAKLTGRVGVLVAGVALRVMRTERSGASKPLVGAVRVAPPPSRPPTAVKMSVGTAFMLCVPQTLSASHE